VIRVLHGVGRGVHGASRLIRARQSLDGGRGMVSTETALVIPMLLVIALALISALSAVAAHQSCADAARQVVRVLARGDDRGVAEELVATLAPAGATLTVSHSDGLVTAEVAATVMVGVGRLSRAYSLSASSVAAVEDTW
jgi:Flp pilus assembly protein TadG